jgi:RNA polymerase-binding transcription factor
VAKKTTKKTAAKTGGKTKASPSTSKKTTKKAAAKKLTKKVTKKVTKKATKPKSGSPASKKTKSSPKKAAPKKKTTKKTTKKAAAKTTPVDPADNGKLEKTAGPAPAISGRVVRPAPPPVEENALDDWTPLSDAKLRKLKSGLSRKELNEFKALLMEKRAEIVGDVQNMEEARASGNGGDLSNMPLHMADIGSDNYEQEFTLGLVESERKLLVEIDRALMRIKDRTYGVCIISGNPIPKARLEIKPWAKYSIEIVREREKRGLHSF